MVIKVTDQSFDEVVIKSETPVIVDFSATWCGPCRTIEPFIEEISEEYAGKVKVAKVDVDDCIETSARFGIRNIPTVLYFKNGEVVNKNVGGAPKKVFVEKLQSIL